MSQYSFSISSSVVLAMLYVTSGCSNDTDTQNVLLSPHANSVLSVLEQTQPTQFENPFSNVFDDARLTELSGLQRSLLLDGIYYVNNDSGTDPLIYVSDFSGQVLGSMNIINAGSGDWEALAGARHDGRNLLVIADTGNNAGQRKDLRLWVLEEPTLSKLEPGFELDLTAERIALNYSDGLSYDAEALFVGGDNDTIVLLTKNNQKTSDQSIWTGSLSSGLIEGSLSLQFNGMVNLPSEEFTYTITGVDLHPNGREVAVLTYGALPGSGSIHLWISRDGEGTTDALLRPADETLSVPVIGLNLQAESVSYTTDGNALLVGAEGISRSTLTVVKR